VRIYFLIREIMAMQLCKCLVNNINVNITGIVKNIDIKAISTKGFTKTRVNMKTMEKKHHTVGTVPKFIRKIVERSKIYTPNTQILDSSLFCISCLFLVPIP
jgi:hypothetical protein